MRDRGAAIIIKDSKIALIKRETKEAVYYVFPGGGIEENETPDLATVREIKEELGLDIKTNSLFTVYNYKSIKQYYFICEVLGGDFGTGSGEEFDRIQVNNRYTPLWIELSKLCTIDIKPKDVALKILSNIKVEL
jgi:8-oxo-dGTP diphosphatase